MNQVCLQLGRKSRFLFSFIFSFFPFVMTRFFFPFKKKIFDSADFDSPLKLEYNLIDASIIQCLPLRIGIHLAHMQNRSRLVKKIVTLKTSITIKIIIEPGSSITPFNPITWEAEASGSLSAKPV